ncbi:MAG: transposase [Burkholderiaceae bacterium]
MLRDPQSSVGALIRPTLVELVLEIKQLEDRIDRLEHDLGRLARQSSACQDLMSVPGVGLITATAMVAATAGSVSHFSSARHFASWLGLTPREHSSGNRQRLGRISKRGDKHCACYSCTAHGRAAISNAANEQGPAARTNRALGQNIQRRGAHANKPAAPWPTSSPVCFAVPRDQQPYREHHAELSTPITNTQHPVLAH